MRQVSVSAGPALFRTARAWKRYLPGATDRCARVTSPAPPSVAPAPLDSSTWLGLIGPAAPWGPVAPRAPGEPGEPAGPIGPRAPRVTRAAVSPRAGTSANA